MKKQDKKNMDYSSDITAESYSVRDARANFSQLITGVEKEGKFYGIKKRGKLVGVLVDYETAKELTDLKRLEKEDRVRSREKALEMLNELHKSQPKPKKLVDISGNIDKILYGI